jgi:nickel transport protein
MIRLILLFSLFAVVAAAHDMEFQVGPVPNAVAVRFGYGPEDPARNAPVRVFAPGDSDTPYQTGHTDQRGVFVFAPSEPGVWRVVADDEEGHREEARVTVTGEGAVRIDTHSHSRGGTLVTGLSVLFGITGLTLWWTGRRRSGSPA